VLLSIWLLLRDPYPDDSFVPEIAYLLKTQHDASGRLLMFPVLNSNNQSNNQPTNQQMEALFVKFTDPILNRLERMKGKIDSLEEKINSVEKKIDAIQLANAIM